MAGENEYKKLILTYQSLIKREIRVINASDLMPQTSILLPSF
jgi:hypothetical protein